MENDIRGWLSFARKVEIELDKIDQATFSEAYTCRLFDLMEQIRTEADLLRELSIIEKQESYMRINVLGSELKSAAYFAN